ncbi:MAG TPA: pilus assembly protein PilM [Herbaspirillum sp.]
MAFSVPHYFKPALLLGLDIGPAALRMVELSQGADRRFRLERHAMLVLPAGVIADRHIQHPAQLAEHIAALAARLGSKRKRVALALPADAVFMRPMAVPAHIGATALEQLIAAEAGGYLNLTPDQVRVDYQFSRTGPDGAAEHEIVLAAARREQVEDRIAAVEAAGLTPAVLDIDLYAAHAACLPAGNGFEMRDQDVLVLLMCDAARTQVALFDRHQLLHHRELPGCGQNADVLHIAAAATRALPLALPPGASLSQFFIGGDCSATRLHELCEALQAMTAQLEQAGQSTVACKVVQAFAAMQIGKAAAASATTEGDDTHVPNHSESGDDADHPAAYLVACGLAMRRSAS